MFTQFGLPIVDIILATILGFNYLYRVWHFKESIFALSDGFNEEELQQYRDDVLEVADVIKVNSLKGRYHGSSIF